MRHRKNIFKDKSFLVMSGVSVLALVGIGAGMIMQNTNSTENESGYISDLNGNNQADIDEVTENSADNEISSADIAANSGAKKETDANADENESSDEASDTANDESSDTTADNTQESSENTAALSDNEEDTSDSGSSEAGAAVLNFHFSAESTLVWPVETTDIILDFSPDATVYFATLDKYKTNDSICIRSETGTPVYAASDGIVNDIGYNEEIGNSVSLDLGDGYTLQYGQIKDIQVSEGDVVTEGDLLCYVANPTKYYSVEGPNLYLKLTNGDTALDPVDYLDYE